jgi:hypothetical protein
LLEESTSCEIHWSVALLPMVASDTGIILQNRGSFFALGLSGNCRETPYRLA